MHVVPPKWSLPEIKKSYRSDTFNASFTGAFGLFEFDVKFNRQDLKFKPGRVVSVTPRRVRFSVLAVRFSPLVLSFSLTLAVSFSPLVLSVSVLAGSVAVRFSLLVLSVSLTVTPAVSVSLLVLIFSLAVNLDFFL